MIKSINFIIPLVVYPFDVMVSVHQTDEQLIKVLKKYNINWDEDCKLKGTGLCVMFSSNQCLIRLHDFPKTIQEYDTVAHEIFHCVTFILDRIGMKFVLEESDEAYSYLVGYLTREIYKVLYKHQKLK